MSTTGFTSVYTSKGEVVGEYRRLAVEWAGPEWFPPNVVNLTILGPRGGYIGNILLSPEEALALADAIQDKLRRYHEEDST